MKNLEIFNKIATKGYGVEQLCSMLGISRQEMITVGDSDNDVTMLEAAGLGLAVKNAALSTKNAADKIICSNDENILCCILENILAENK